MNNQNIYATGKIYKIHFVDFPDTFYIGSTTQTLHQRWLKHKSDATRVSKCGYLLYQTLNEIGLDKFSIELVEEHPCESRLLLLQREAYWITMLQPTLNIKKPWISVEEKKWKDRKHHVKYYANNKEKIKKRRTKKSDCNLCGRVVLLRCMKRHQRSKRCQLETYNYVEIEFIDSDKEADIEFVD